jgi:16S rRNA (guanine966-N2)-methyltransferase
VRIISGEYKNRKIHSGSLDTNSLRPASDRTRETLFNILTHRIDLEGMNCFDLFAGTGAYGFEALSRGAAYCTFIDNTPASIELIEKTAADLGCADRVKTIRADVLEFLKTCGTLSNIIIFADPPYSYAGYENLIRLVFSGKFKVFVLEFPKSALQLISELIRSTPDDYIVIDRNIGSTYLKIIISR